MFDVPTLALAEEVGRRLGMGGRVLATAESCTGGLVAGAITAIAGSSAWFERGFVTYSNEAKMDELEVGSLTLDAYGAVSEQTAREMALGALHASGASVAVSTTGIAGPDGATPGKPVGMVCFAWVWDSPEGLCSRTVTEIFPGDRAAVREASVVTALRGLLLVPTA
jgi:nicotinamide-nucleotide amidase